MTIEEGVTDLFKLQDQVVLREPLALTPIARSVNPTRSP